MDAVSAILKLFKELDLYAKSVILSILLLIPFWYVVLYFTDGDFVKRIPRHVYIILCFCLSFCWYISVTLLMLITKVCYSPDDKEFPDSFLGLCGVMAILLLSGASI